MSEHHPQQVPVRVIADRYAVVDEIGRGGMGVGWRAEDRMCVFQDSGGALLIGMLGEELRSAAPFHPCPEEAPERD